MKPYNPAASCPKCGHKDVRTSYQANTAWAAVRWDCDHYGCVEDHREHLHRVCQNCHYGWQEACLDQSGVDNDAVSA